MSETLIIATREAFIAEARSFIGTPFHHQGRLKGIGIDCVGLPVCSGRNVGFTVHDCTTYPRTPDGHTLIEWMDKNCERTDELIPGNMPIFWLLDRLLPQHLGILTPYGILHTYADVGKVCEHKLTKAWRKRIHSVYRLRGIAP